MAHLSIEYSANLEPAIDMAAFCEVARAAMAATGTFPVAGIRVRAFRADHVAIGDGGADLGFADMVLRMGRGRDEATRLAATEAIYAAMERWLDGRLDMPFALSLEVLELNYPFAEKRLNTIRAALLARGTENV
ncbi:MAG: 5-carboxymethyl-2-hydroxymuconate isomerase [Rhodobacteraceae bacterium]|nr:5-carboxymethyl-2-hydroxymuconate isomerase [Paracoccaceae bacterium]